MSPRAFPFPLRVGTDLCHISRIRALLQKNIGQQTRQTKTLSRFLSKLLTWPERQYFWERFEDHDYVCSNIDTVAQYLAGRWAAKEACRKACPHLKSSNGFHNIMILPIHVPTGASHRASTRPQGLILRTAISAFQVGISEQQSGKKQLVFDMDTVEGQLCEISISHDADLATAVAIVPVMVDDYTVEEKT
ncbi:hypothetical protein K504DRAFT_473288 [Pleomassaria siparia CBS 279.74]|uniref:4'-phosphopantetheinyl transferase domain-containing protein n=1 Tax=Pleomassaria siparia CBS 279.74 TaxID=1314801 RepID=A0A6G1KMY7_9PLEO|nr:hypothetical protein K504DRAFT_473288 [Pleomassaria siparia CBS 279.74]